MSIISTRTLLVLDNGDYPSPRYLRPHMYNAIPSLTCSCIRSLELTNGSPSVSAGTDGDQIGMHMDRYSLSLITFKRLMGAPLGQNRPQIKVISIQLPTRDLPSQATRT
jgi:hypothetical protein